MHSLLLSDFGADLHVTTNQCAFQCADQNAPHFEAFFILPELKFFSGHFPGNPILPAFATIEISLALGRQLDLLGGVKKISNAKFLSALKVGDSIKVLIRRAPTGVDFEWQQLQGSDWKKASEISVE